MRLLLVEDSQRLRATLVRALARLGYAVDEARDGDEAMASVGLHPSDAIILDLMLPGMSGYAVCETIRNENIILPILILSARSLPEDRAR